MNPDTLITLKYCANADEGGFILSAQTYTNFWVFSETGENMFFFFNSYINVVILKTQ